MNAPRQSDNATRSTHGPGDAVRALSVSTMAETLSLAGRLVLAAFACRCFSELAQGLANGADIQEVAVALIVPFLLCISLYRMRSYALLGLCLAVGALAFAVSLVSATLVDAGKFLADLILLAAPTIVLVRLVLALLDWNRRNEEELDKLE